MARPIDGGLINFCQPPPAYSVVLTYPGHCGLPRRKVLKENMFSYISGKIHSLTSRTGDELWRGKTDSGAKQQSDYSYSLEGGFLIPSTNIQQAIFPLCRHDLYSITQPTVSMNMTIPPEASPPDHPFGLLHPCLCLIYLPLFPRSQVTTDSSLCLLLLQFFIL